MSDTIDKLNDLLHDMEREQGSVWRKMREAEQRYETLDPTTGPARVAIAETEYRRGQADTLAVCRSRIAAIVRAIYERDEAKETNQ